jgi:hypothetical protein
MDVEERGLLTGLTKDEGNGEVQDQSYWVILSRLLGDK